MNECIFYDFTGPLSCRSQIIKGFLTDAPDSPLWRRSRLKIEKFCPRSKIAQRVSLVQLNRISCLNEKTWISTPSIPDWTPLLADFALLQMVLDGKAATRLQRLLPPTRFENSLGCASPVATSLGSLWKMDPSASLMASRRRQVTVFSTESFHPINQAVN